MSIKPRVRWALSTDLTDIMAIDHAASRDPWTREQAMRFFAKRSSILMVATLDVTLPSASCVVFPGFPQTMTRVAGFMVYTLGPNTGGICLAKLAVAPELQRRGVGRALLAELARKLDDRREVLVTEVAETNLAAQLFLRACRWRAQAVVQHEPEDTYLFTFERPRVSITGAIPCDSASGSTF